MREIRTSGSEGGAGRKPRSYLYRWRRSEAFGCGCGRAVFSGGVDGMLLIQDLAVVLVMACAAAWVCRRFGLSAVVGYLIAGAIIGPFTPPFALVSDLDRVHTLAQLGLVFLIFSIGLNLSLSRLKRLGLPVVVATLIGALVVLNGGRLFGLALGWQAQAGLFLAGMLMVSSSAIISKVLGELKLTHERPGQLALGITVLEDVVAVTMLTLLTSLATFGGEKAPSLGGVLGGLAAFVVLVAVLSLLVMPKLLCRVTRGASPEIRTLLVGGLLLSLAWLAVQLGYSLALGAFVFGAIIGSTRFKADVERSFEGLDQIFGAVFFVAVGMMVDFEVLSEAWPLVLAVAAVAIVLRPVACALGLLAVGNSTRNSVQAGLALVPLGEFSFIIAQLGVESGVLPKSAYPVAVGASLLTSLAAPVITRRAEGVGRLAARHEPALLRRWSAFLQDLTARFHARDGGGVLWKLTAWRFVQVGAMMAIVSGLLVFANPLIRAVSAGIGFGNGRESLVPVLLWGGFGLVLLGPLIAIWRNVAALAMMFAEAAAGSGKRQAKARFFLETLMQVVAMTVIGFWLAALLPAGYPRELVLLLCLLLLLVAVVFWRRFIRIQSRIEIEFSEQFHEAIHVTATSPWSSMLPRRSADWKLDIEEVVIPPDTAHAGKTLGELALRGRFGCSVVGIDRHGHGVVNPRASAEIYPGDKLLLFGKPSQIAETARELGATSPDVGMAAEFDELILDTVTIPAGCPLAGKTLIELDLIRRYGIQIGGIRHGRKRRLTPAGDDRFEEGDELLVLGSQARIREFSACLGGKSGTF